MTGEPAKIFHGVGIGPLSKILAVNALYFCFFEEVSILNILCQFAGLNLTGLVAKVWRLLKKILKLYKFSFKTIFSQSTFKKVTIDIAEPNLNILNPETNLF